MSVNHNIEPWQLLPLVQVIKLLEVLVFGSPVVACYIRSTYYYHPALTCTLMLGYSYEAIQ